MKSLIEFIRELAAASGEVIVRYFRTPMTTERKSDATPVTIADRQAEAVMRQMIMARFPEHGIYGEEGGRYNSTSEYQWMLDPIDGTQTFIAGSYLFGTLIALLKNERPVLGAIHHPVTGQLLIGDGQQTWLNGVSVSVRGCSTIEAATLLTTSHWDAHQTRNGAAFDALARRARLYRTWGDCHGYYLVATGYADIMIDASADIWDAATMIPIITGAGGVITDYYGRDPLSGDGLIATSGDIHAEVLRSLNPAQLQREPSAEERKTQCNGKI